MSHKKKLPHIVLSCNENYGSGTMRRSELQFQSSRIQNLGHEIRAFVANTGFSLFNFAK